ncbi:MAG: transposase, partial [Anaerovibrio sp.]|nr:transposase [Anaerovibrio sp.]
MNDIKGNGLVPIIAQALEVMEAKAGCNIPLDKVNLAELGRLTGLSRSKLRTLKKNGFQNGIKSKLPCVKRKGKLDAFKEVINTYLKQGVTNSAVIFSELKKEGFTGGLTIVKNYIYSNKDLVPAKRILVAPQGSRGRRYTTQPGEAFQMDWGFTKVVGPSGEEYQVACFAIVCHHCCSAYIEFFSSAKQENLFIGLVRAFDRLGVPDYILTDNM